jgi:hypothetical protein
MELLEFPAEILIEIFSYLRQKDCHLKAALVCKRFLHLTRSPQLLKCVYYRSRGLISKNIQSLLDMLRDNKHIEKLILKETIFQNDDILEILKVVAPHGSLRHLDLGLSMFNDLSISENNQEEWEEVFSQICAKLTSFESDLMTIGDDFDCYAPLANAKYLTTLKLVNLPSSETIREMADNYTCLQNIEFFDGDVDCSENSDVAYFLEKQSETLTSLMIETSTVAPLIAISKCQHLKKLHLCSTTFKIDVILNGLEGLSNLRYLFLQCITSDLGHAIATANLQHLNEIHLNLDENLTDNDISQIARTYGKQVYL